MKRSSYASLFMILALSTNCKARRGNSGESRINVANEFKSDIEIVELGVLAKAGLDTNSNCFYLADSKMSAPSQKLLYFKKLNCRSDDAPPTSPASFEAPTKPSDFSADIMVLSSPNTDIATIRRNPQGNLEFKEFCDGIHRLTCKFSTRKDKFVYMNQINVFATPQIIDIP